MAVNSFADKLVKKIFGTSSDIFLKNVKPVIQEINDWEPKLEKMSDAELQAQTQKLREQLQGGKTLEDILPEAFATVREA